jgi:threonine dehydrogenase-like Zn-dependent dehydrogenase
MRFGRRAILEDIAATVLMAGTVLGYAATHENWNVWLIGDSRRWTAGLLTVFAVAMLALVTRHIGGTAAVVLGSIAVGLAAVAFWTAWLTPLSLLGVTIILLWALAVVRDAFVVPHRTASI